MDYRKRKILITLRSIWSKYFSAANFKVKDALCLTSTGITTTTMATAFGSTVEQISQIRAMLTMTSYHTQLRSLIKTGWRNGLRLELLAGSQSEQIQYAYKIGYRIIVHNQSTVVFPDQDGVDVPTNNSDEYWTQAEVLESTSQPLQQLHRRAHRRSFTTKRHHQDHV